MRASEITIDDVAGAYEATGLKPQDGNVRPRNGACCGLGALVAVAGLGSDPTKGLTALGDELGIESPGAVVFAQGFDEGFTGRQQYRFVNADEERGYEIGKALRGWKPSSKKNRKGA